jgi:hypothetical protein
VYPRASFPFARFAVHVGERREAELLNVRNQLLELRRRMFPVRPQQLDLSRCADMRLNLLSAARLDSSMCVISCFPARWVVVHENYSLSPGRQFVLCMAK